MDSIVNAAIQHGKLEKRIYDEFEGADRLKIVVLGTGGAGNNTINRLHRIGVEGAELIASNTDKQDLQKLDGSMIKILIGAKLMRGLGAGGFPELGEKAAEARVWEPGTPMRWEAEEYHIKETIKKEGDSIIIETPHLKVVLNKDEIEKIKGL